MFTVTINTVSKKTKSYEFEENPVLYEKIIEKIIIDSTFECPSQNLIKLICKGKILKNVDMIDVLENPLIVIMISKKKNQESSIPENVISVESSIPENVISINPQNDKSAPINPFITNPSVSDEMQIDENAIVMLTISQYIIIKQNPELGDLLDISDNLVQKFIDSGLTNIEDLSDPQIAHIVLTNYLKQNEKGIKLVEELTPLCKKLINQMAKDGEIGIVITKDKINDIQSSDEFLDKMSSERLYSLKMNIIENNPHITDMIFSFNDEQFKKFMKDQRKISKIKEQLDKMYKESPHEFKIAIHMFINELDSNELKTNKVEQELSEEDNIKIREISLNFGFDYEDVKRFFIACDKNSELTVNTLYD